MKSKRESVLFIPVNLILETQAEVDAIYTVLNHVRMIEVLGLDQDAFEALRMHKSSQADELHKKLHKLIGGAS